MHADFDIAVRELFPGERVIEIFCIMWVDGEGQHIAEVSAFSELFRRDRERDRFSCRCHIRVESRGESALENDRFHLYLVRVRLAEYLEHCTHRLFLCIGPRGHLHEDLVAFLCAIQLVCRYQDIAVHAEVIRREKRGPVLAKDDADEFCFLSKKDLGHFACFVAVELSI